MLIANDWSGFDKLQPDLFFPKPLREVWWHFPLEMGAAWVGVYFIARREGWIDEDD